MNTENRDNILLAGFWTLFLTLTVFILLLITGAVKV
jgi:hypothetical protein